MKIPCPRCGRGAAVEDEVGDFPTRCQSCGALLRRRSTAGEPEGSGGRVSADMSAGIRRGALAGMLSRTPGAEPAMMASGGMAVAACDSAHGRVLRPESRREIARAHARQQALERARLRGSHQALGALTWAGMILAVLLGIGAAVLKAQALWQHPTPGRADVLRVE